jgi:hypothetical protein
MELDINTDWVNLATYDPTPNQPAGPGNGANLLPAMTGGASRYFETWWGRDFVTMNSASGPDQALPLPTASTTSGPSHSLATKANTRS